PEARVGRGGCLRRPVRREPARVPERRLVPGFQGAPRRRVPGRRRHAEHRDPRNRQARRRAAHPRGDAHVLPVDGVVVADRLRPPRFGKRVRFVEVAGVRVSVIGLGTWQFGSREWGYGRDYATQTAGPIVKRALELGINLIDTAEIYGFGRSEQIVGAAIRDRRGEVFIASKLFPIGLPFMVPARARASARRLGVDRMDLYQMHWP